MVALINVLAVIAHAETCDEVLTKCDAALKAEQQLVLVQKDLIHKQNTQIDLLQKDLDLERERSNAWYKNPLIIGPGAILVFELLKGALTR